MKRYYNNKDDILKKRRDNHARFKDLDIQLKALEEKQSVKNNFKKMTQKLIKVFRYEIYSKTFKTNYITTKLKFIFLTTFGLYKYKIGKIMILRLIVDIDLFC